jgi:hypothetical protein
MDKYLSEQVSICLIKTVGTRAHTCRHACAHACVCAHTHTHTHMHAHTHTGKSRSPCSLVNADQLAPADTVTVGQGKRCMETHTDSGLSPPPALERLFPQNGKVMLISWITIAVGCVTLESPCSAEP